MSNTPQLPRGIWFEEAKNRFRVRLYRNNIAYMGGYFKSLPEAEAALKTLHKKVDAIPKERRDTGRNSQPHSPSMTGQLDALQRSATKDPRITRHKSH